MLKRNTETVVDSNKKSNLPATRASKISAPVEQLEERRHFAATSFDIGINLNSATETAFRKSIPIMKKLGVDSVRLWMGVDDFNKPVMETSLKRAIEASNAGFDVMVIVSTDDGKIPQPAAVKNWFNWAMDNDALRNAVDRWEIGNEPDLDHYWQGTIKQYVTNFLKPASEVLRAHGEKVVSAGPAWNPQDVQEMINYGMLGMVDYIGFHPYAKGVRLQQQRIQELHDVVKGRKPLVASEWNVRGYENSSKSAWADAIEDAYKNIKNGFEQNYYFVLFTMNSMAGPAGILKPDGSINQPFYDAFATFAKQAGGSTGGGDSEGPVVGNPPPVGTPTDGGNTPSQVTSTIGLYNANSNAVISGYTSIDNGDIINLANLPTRSLALVANTSSKAQSVKMTLNGKTVIQNSVPYAYYNDVGGDLNGVALTPGEYTMVVTPYSQDSAAGSAYTTRTIKFTVVDKPTTGGSTSNGTPEVKSYSLIDTRTNTVISGYSSITSSLRIDLSDLPTRSLALRVNTDTDTSSVRLSGAGVSRVENSLPYAVFGDDHGDYGTWTPKLGASYTINATAYSKDNAQGIKGNTKTVTLSFI